SQGGGASASAAELAPEYAPDLDLVGAYAGAVPADLQKVAEYIDGGLYTGFELYAVNGIAEAYDIDLGPYTTDEGMRRVRATRDECVGETVAGSAFEDTGDYTTSGKKLSELTAEEPFASIVAEQLIGDGRAPDVPVLVGQSVLDDVVPYAQARALAVRWCDQGTKVRFERTYVPTHVGAAAGLFPSAFAYLDARFAGGPARSSCGRL
ncbi:MAG: lipase family protein, partial [Nocardioidaceae bacterium]